MKAPELDPRFSGGARLPYPDERVDGAKVFIAIAIVWAWGMCVLAVLAAVVS